jgi:hypothetical protein
MSRSTDLAIWHGSTGACPHRLQASPIQSDLCPNTNARALGAGVFMVARKANATRALGASF